MSLVLADAGQWIGLALLLGGVLVTLIGKAAGGKTKRVELGGDADRLGDRRAERPEFVVEEEADDDPAERARWRRAQRDLLRQIYTRRREIENAIREHRRAGSPVPPRLERELQLVAEAANQVEAGDFELPPEAAAPAAAPPPPPRRPEPPRPQPSPVAATAVAKSAVSKSQIGTGGGGTRTGRANPKADRLLALLRRRESARTVIVATEVLGPPVALRDRR